MALKLKKPILTGAARMCVQLGFVGLYLEVIFRLNSAFLNLVYLLLMIIIACSTVLKSSRLRLKRFFLPLFAALLLPFGIVLLFFETVVVPVSNLFDARYLIPIGGMLLGNCLRSLVIALDRFYSGIHQNTKAYAFTLSLYNSQFHAVLPWARQSIRAAMAPTTASMASIGLVSLPGMMTGQILGGSIPMLAIKYQIAIMAAIFYTEFFSTILSLLLSVPFAFNRLSMLNQNIFRKGNDRPDK